MKKKVKNGFVLIQSLLALLCISVGMALILTLATNLNTKESIWDELDEKEIVQIKQE